MNPSNSGFSGELPIKIFVFKHSPTEEGESPEAKHFWRFRILDRNRWQFSGRPLLEPESALDSVQAVKLGKFANHNLDPNLNLSV